MSDLLDLWFLIIPGGLVLFVVGIILNSIFNIKPATDGRPITRAPAGSDSTDSSFSATTDLSTYPGSDSGSNSSASDSGGHGGGSGGGESGGGDSGGGGDGGGGGGD